MRITSPAVTIKAIWDALVADYGVVGSYGILLETNLDGKVSLAKADLSTLEGRLSAARALLLDDIGKEPYVSVSDVLIASSDATVSEAGTVYVKKKEIYILVPGHYRVKGEIRHTTGAYFINAQVWKNGAAHGGAWNTNETTFQPQSEDLFFARDDLCQLYIKVSTVDGEAEARNFRLCGDLGTEIAFEV